MDGGCSNGAWWQVGGYKMLEEAKGGVDRGGGNCGIGSRGFVVEVTVVVVDMAVDRW